MCQPVLLNSTPASPFSDLATCLSHLASWSRDPKVLATAPVLPHYGPYTTHITNLSLHFSRPRMWFKKKDSSGSAVRSYFSFDTGRACALAADSHKENGHPSNPRRSTAPRVRAPYGWLFLEWMSMFFQQIPIQHLLIARFFSTCFANINLCVISDSMKWVL